MLKYINNKPRLVILCGPAGSGKSYYVNQFFHEFEYMSADLLRKVVHGNESEQKDGHIIFDILEKMVKYQMELGHPIVLDNTSLYPKARKQWIDLGKKYNYYIEAKVFNVNYETCIERISKRDRKVDISIIKKQFEKFIYPTKDEGFDEIAVF